MAFKNINVLLTANSTNLSSTLAKAGTQVDRFGKQVESSSAGMGKWASVAKGTGIAALAVGTALAYAVNQAAKFDTQMRNVQSLTHQTDASLAALSKEVVNLSRQLPQSAATLAAGLYDIASSGFQGADGLKVLRASATAASAGLSTTATSAQAITAVLNAYGRGASEAGDISDVLFQTVNLGVVTFDELAGSIGDVVGTAAAAGVQIDQVGAAIATMTLSGISGQEAATSLNRLLQALIQPSDALASEMSKLGIGLDDLKNPAIGLSGVMDKLQEASHGNVTTLLQWFPEIRAARGAFALMADSGNKYAQIALQITDKQARAGATAAALREQMKSLSGQFQLFKNWVNAGAIELGTHLLPPLIEALKWIRGLATDAVPILNQALATAMPLIHDVGDFIGDWAVAQGKLMAVLAPLAGALAGIAFVGLVNGLKAVVDILDKFQEFLINNEWAVRALAIVLGGMLVKAAAEAVFALAEVRGAVLATSFAEAIASVKMFVGSFATLAAVNGGGTLGVLRTAAGGVGAALTSTTVIATAFVGELMTMKNWLDNARKAGKDMAEGITKGMDPNNVKSMTDALEGLHMQQVELENTANKGGFFERLKTMADIAIPFQDIKNTAGDASRALEGMSGTTEDLEKHLALLNIITGDLSGSLGLSTQAVADWVAKLGIDLNVTPYQDAESAITDAANAAKNGSPSLDALQKAFASVSDETSTATDRLKAYKDALDAVVGIHISAFEAATKTSQAMADLAATIVKNGSDMSDLTQAGRDNRDALSGAAQAALDHASAVANETGSIAQGNQTLQQHVAQLMAVMKQAGFTDGAIADMIQQMGLTPQNLQTLVQLNGKEAALQGLADVQTMVANTDGRRARVFIDVMRGIVQEPDGSFQQEFPDVLSGKKQGVPVQHNGQPMVAQAVNISLPKAGPIASGGSAGGGGGGDNGAKAYLDGLAKEREEIAKNIQARQLAAASLQDRAKMLDGLISHEKAYTNEWVRLTEMREETQKQIDEAAKKRAEETKAYLDGVWASRLDAEKNMYEAGRVSGDAYIEMLKQQHQRMVQQYGYWSDEAKGVRDQIVAVQKDTTDKVKDQQDKQYALGEISKDDYLRILDQRLAGEQKYSDAYMAIWRQRQQLSDELNQEERQKAQQAVDDLVHIYESASSAFQAQRNSALQTLEGVYERAKSRIDDLHDLIQKGIVDLADVVGTFGGKAQPVSRDEVTAMLEHRLEAARRWADAVQQLKKSNIDKELQDSLIRGGPTNLNLVDSLLGGNNDAINAMIAQIRDLGGSVADQVVTQADYNTALQEEIDAQRKTADAHREASDWAQRWVNELGPGLSDSWKTFNQLLGEEVSQQSLAKTLHDDATAWAEQTLKETNPALFKSYQQLTSAVQAYAAALSAAADAQAKMSSPGAQGGATKTATGATKGGVNTPGVRYTNTVGANDMIYVGGKFLPPGASYDSGGHLPTGWSLAYNGTGRPEPVGHNLGGDTYQFDVKVAIDASGGANPSAVGAAARSGVESALNKVAVRLTAGARR